MQVKHLSIQRTASCETPANTLVGVVEVSCEYGEQKIRLSSKTISAIFDLIKAEAQAIAIENASRVTRALEDAAAEQLIEAPRKVEVIA